MPHHNKIIIAYLTRLHLLGEHIKTLYHANTRYDKKQGVGHRELHFSKITLSTLRLASFTTYIPFHYATIYTIIHGSNSRTHNSIRISSIYTHTDQKPIFPSSFKAIRIGYINVVPQKLVVFLLLDLPILLKSRIVKGQKQ